MTMREGSLEAPTRHPIDWKNPEYYDEAQDPRGDGAHLRHLPRVPALREPVQHVPHALRPTSTRARRWRSTACRKEKYWEVVDQCYLCDLCYMMKCPYVPPHPWNVDFPHLMLRAKAYQFREGTPHQVRDAQLSSTDRNGKLATIPVVVQIVNAAAKSKPLRALGEKVIGVDKDAWVPEFAPRTFRRTRAPSKPHPVKDGERTPGKVAIFSTCYVNYNEPGIGHDLLKILDHNEIPYVLVEKEACCGMPKLEQGDLETRASSSRTKNIPLLAQLAREGYAILTPVPSCTLMFKQELPLMFPRGRGREGGARRDVRSVRVPRWRATRTGCSRPTSSARSARSRTTSPATRACRRSARRRARRSRWCRAPRC